MNITVYLGSTLGDSPAFAQAAEDVGAWIGRGGHTLVYGGSDIGCMGRLARAVLATGGRVIGVEPQFFVDDPTVPQIPSDLTLGLSDKLDPTAQTQLIVCDTMAQRMTRMVELGELFIALPGGPGTLEEISEIISLVKMDAVVAGGGFAPGGCVLYDVNGFWEPLAAQLDAMVAHGFFPANSRARIHLTHSPAQLDALIS